MRRVSGHFVGLIALFAGCPSPEQPTATDTGVCLDMAVAPTSMHRLSNTEYARSILQVLDVELDVAGFASDQAVDGFDNHTEGQVISTILVEQYANAAVDVAATAAGTVGQSDRYEVEHLQLLDGASTQLASGTSDWWVMSWGNPGFDVQVTIEHDGEYTMSIPAIWFKGWEDERDEPEPALLSLAVDGQELGEWEVDALFDAPEEFSVTTAPGAGEHTVSISLEWRGPDLVQTGIPAIAVDYLQLSGPTGGIAPSSAISECEPDETPQDCGRRVLPPVVRRAWRRPVTEDELDALVSLVTLAIDEGDPFSVGLSLAIEAILLSPHFAFVIEAPPDPTDAAWPLQDHAIAARLALLVYSGAPDDELLDCADNALLLSSTGPCTINHQLARMLSDEKADGLVADFGRQLLQINDVPDLYRDPDAFPDFDATLGQSMNEETDRFLAEIIGDDHPITSLLNADFTWIDPTLAELYGMTHPTGVGFARVKVDDRRGGVLRQASVLTATSATNRTSPVNRGRFTLTQLMCDPPAPPPDNVPDLLGSPDEESGADLLAAHRDDPACAPCHDTIDPIGLAFENYDAIGTWRDTIASGEPVVASGTLPDGTELDGAGDLIDWLVNQPETSSCFAEQLLTWGARRSVSFDDRCVVEAMAVPGHPPTVQSMLSTYTSSPAFLNRTVEEER